MNNEELILERLDRIESQIAPLVQTAKGVAELKEDLMPLGHQAVQLLIKELEDVESGFQLEDLLALMKRMLRSSKDITFALDQLQSIIDLVTTLEPLLKSSVPKLIHYLDELEQKGVIRVVQAMLDVRAKVANAYSPEDIKAVMDTNTMGTMNMTHTVLPGMLSRGRGSVLNVVSTGALCTRKSISVYAASKWAIRGFTGCLEAECAPKGVRVMGFYPGKIASNMYETAGVERDLRVAMTPEQAADMIVTMLNDESMVWSQVSGRALKDYV